MQKKHVILFVIAAAMAAAVYYYVQFYRPYNTMIPPVDRIETIKPAVQKLSDSDKEVFARYLVRKTIQKAFNMDAKMSADVTIGQAITEQKAFEAEKKQSNDEKQALKADLEKKSKALKEQLEGVLTITLLSKTFSPSDYRRGTYEDTNSMTVGLENKGNKDIKGFKGTIVFKDIFGDTIKEINWSFDDGIKAGEKKKWFGTVPYNQFKAEDKKLAQTEAEKLQFEFLPEIILFTDGSKIDVKDIKE